MRPLILVFLVACAASPVLEEAGDSEGFAVLPDGVGRFEDRPGHYVLRQVLSERRKEGRWRMTVVQWSADEDTLPTTLFASDTLDEETAASLKRYYARGGDAPKGKAVELLRQDRPSRGVWEATREWTAEDELAYGAWLETVNADLLKGSGVLADCADAAVLLRWIYAHDHGLPVANQLPGSNQLFGHFSTSSSWSSLPTHTDWRQDRRFKKAFAYLRDKLYTHSLVKDLYPVALNRTYVSPGGVHLALRDVSGHTETIRHIGPEGESNCAAEASCLQTIWGNVPAADQLWISELIEAFGLPEKQGGFMRFRAPYLQGSTWKLRAAKDHAGYSLEQFEYATLDRLAFQEMIYAKLGIVLPARERVKIFAWQMLDLLFQRGDVTLRGFIKCGFTPCPEGGVLYEEWSTPTRDARIRSVEAAVQTLLPEMTPEEIEAVRVPFRSMGDVVPGLSYERLIFEDGVVARLVSDPNVDYFLRWGVTFANDDEALPPRTWLATSLWFMRIYDVSTAQYYCFPNGGEAASCSQTDPNVLSVATTELDAAIRTYDAGLRALVVTPETLALAQAYLTSIGEWWKGCPEKPEGYCLLSDYLLSDGARLARMTSQPWDHVRLRMAF